MLHASKPPNHLHAGEWRNRATCNKTRRYRTAVNVVPHRHRAFAVLGVIRWVGGSRSHPPHHHRGVGVKRPSGRRPECQKPPAARNRSERPQKNNLRKQRGLYRAAGAEGAKRPERLFDYNLGDRPKPSERGTPKTLTARAAAVECVVDVGVISVLFPRFRPHLADPGEVNKPVFTGASVT